MDFDNEDFQYHESVPLKTKLSVLAVVFLVVFVVCYLIQIFAPYSLLVLGFFLWWGSYAFTTALNGGQTDFRSLLEYLKQDYLSFIPGGWEYRMNLARERNEMMRQAGSIRTQSDLDVARMFPNRFDIFFQHILIPFAPIIIWWVL